MEITNTLEILLGRKVLVLNNPNNDETFNIKFVGRKGVVKYFDFECGCGQTYPDDPLVGVHFNSGEIEEYWKEELKLI